MLIKKPSDIAPSEITPQGVWLRRRELLKAAVAGTALVTAGGLVSCDQATGGAELSDTPSSGRGKRIANVRPSDYSTAEPQTAYGDVTTYNNFLEFGSGKDAPSRYADALQTRPWTVLVDGECEAPGRIDVEDILTGFTQEERIYRLRCVEAWSMVIPWIGFPLGDLLKRFRPTSNAKYVAFETLSRPIQMRGQRRNVIDWPYREGLRVDEAMHPLAILATGLYGEALPNQNGAPVRLVVPWKYGFKSIKSIVRVSFTATQPPTAWNRLQPDEYGFYANVNPQVDHPRWSQKRERVVGAGIFTPKKDTRLFNGYADQVAGLYAGMDLRKSY
jgi:methionine sulfoxide reductase catalytic subunit